MAATDHVSMSELEAISNAIYPHALANIVMDGEYRVRSIDLINEAIEKFDEVA